MVNAQRSPDAHDDIALEVNAYNAAFYELGLRWHWDRPTYERLLQQSPTATERLRAYLALHHPHLLRAYDADFLIDAIETKKARHLASDSAAGSPSGHFNWADSLGAELGA